MAGVPLSLDLKGLMLKKANCTLAVIPWFDPTQKHIGECVITSYLVLIEHYPLGECKDEISTVALLDLFTNQMQNRLCIDDVS